VKEKFTNLLLGPIKTATFIQSVQTFSATVVNGIFGALFYIFAARYLGPSEFGLLTVSIALLTLLTDVGDLGTDTGLVNFVSKYRLEKSDLAMKYLKLSLKIKFCMWLLILAIGIVIAKPLAFHAFKKPELFPYLRIAFIGTWSMLSFSFITHTLQAYQKFLQWGLLQVVFNFLRLVMMFIIFYLFSISVTNTLWLYIFIPFAGFIVGLTLTPKFWLVKGENSVLREFFHYNKWVAIFTAISALAARMDTFLAASILTSFQLGLYAAASQLVKIIPQFVTALGTVIAPKMATLKNNDELSLYLKKTFSLVGLIIVVGILTIPLIIYFVPIMFGSEYLGSIPIFLVLFIAMLVFLFSVPLHMAVIYYFSYPKLFMYLSVFSLANILLVGYFMLNAYGAIGASYTVLINQVVGFFIPMIWIMKKINHKSISVLSNN